LPETVSSIRGTIELDPSPYNRGLDAAKQATRQFASEADRANVSAREFMAGLEKEAAATARSAAAARQATAFTRELTAARARQAEILAGESRIAQDVAAKYSGLTNAERAELIEVKQAIAAHDAEEKALAKVGNSASQAAGKLRQASRDMVNAGRALSTGLTGPLIAAAGAVLKAGVDVDNGMDAIRIATGATGKPLQALEADFKAVGASVPNSLAEVGQALGAVAARTNLTGAPLQALTTRLLTLSRIMGQDVQQTITTTTRLFGDWGVATRDQAKTLDLLARAHQASNISLGELTRQLVQFGAPLRTVGFNLDQSVALFAKWHKEGVNAAQIATSIRIAISRMINAGVKDVPAAFQQAIRAIQAAKTPADQLALSFKLFGARAGTDMARAIREGRFAIGDLVKTLEQGKGTILDTAKQTDDFKEKFGQLKNAVELTLDPLGAKLMGALTNLAGALQQQVPRLKDTVGWFLKLSPSTQEATASVGLFVAGIGPALFVLGKLGQAFLGMRAGWGLVVTGATSATNALSSFVVGITAAQVAATARFGLIGAAVVAAGAFFVAFANNFDGWRDRFNSGLANIADNFAHVWDNLQTVAGRAWQNLSQNGLGAIRQLGQDFLRGSVEVADTMSLGWQRLWSIVTGKGDPLDRWLADKEKRIRGLAQAQNFVPVATGMMPGNVPRAGFGALREIEENRARAEAGLATRPPPLPGMSPTALGGGVNPPDWMNNLGKKAKNAADEAEKEARRIQRIFAQTQRSALGMGREKGDFATAEEQAALKLYSKGFDELTAAQERTADSLARIIVGGERAAAAMAAPKKELQAHARATDDARAATAKLHAQILDMERVISGGGPRGRGAQAAVRFSGADPQVRALLQQQQAEFDRVKARFDQIVKLRREAEALETRVRAGRPREALIGPPIPTVNLADPQVAALQKRVQQAKDEIARQAAVHKAAAAQTRAALELEQRGWEALGAATNDVITRRKELSGVTATEATLEERLGRAIDFTNVAQVEAAAAILRANRENDQLQQALDAQAKGWRAIADATAAVAVRRDELSGTTRAAATLEQQFAQSVDFTDLAMVQMADDLLRASRALDQQEAALKAGARTAAEYRSVNELLSNTLADLNNEFDQLTGAAPAQTRAFARLSRDTSQLTAAQQQQVKQIQAMFRRRELLSSAKQFADGMGSILGNALEGLQNGFKGFFSGIYQGFRQLLVRMAAEYLASQFQRVVLRGLVGLIGGAFGAGDVGKAGGDVGGAVGKAAMGGSLIAGRPELVGERGPELILPRTAGTVIPNNQLAGALGGGNVTINMTVHATDAGSFRRNLPQMQADLHRTAERVRRRNG
jgi:TP901 family phage tail tape measure protein